MEKINRRFGPIIILILGNAVFFALYLRFFTGDAVYLYTDIGSDSVTSSLPILSMLQRLFAAKDFSGYSLNAGLGSSTATLLLKYLNPMKLPLLFFSGDTLPLGLIAEMLIQTNVIAIFSWLFFSRLLRHGTAALYASLAWTFSGYITLWSQNLTVGSCMACFTVVMAALLPVLRRPTVRRNLLLALALALFLITNYYYCYMTGFFVLVFLIFYVIAERKSFTQFLLSGLQILGCAVFAGALSAVALLPSFAGFAGSGRTTSLTVVGSAISITSPRELFTLLGRLFSVNALGVGNSYTGTMNYYEAAALSTTVLAVLSVVYLLTRENTRLIVIAACLLAAASLVVKNTGAILQFNIGVQRYAFFIAFAEAIAVGFFIRQIMERPFGIPLFWSVVVSLALEGGAIVFLALYDDNLGLHADVRTLKLAAVFAAVFALLFLVYAFSWKISAAMPYLALLALMAELVVMNYDTLYDRTYVTKDDYAALAGAHGIGGAAEEILAQDDGLYRISVGADSDDANAGMLLDFPAASVYSNTNASALTTLTTAQGTCELSPNHFLVNGTEFGQFQLLSGKYLIKDNTGRLTDTPSSIFYEKAFDTADGTKTVYENKAVLPFGYLYKAQLSASEMGEMTLPERIFAMTGAYYRTDGISTTEDHLSDEDGESSTIGSGSVSASGSGVGSVSGSVSGSGNGSVSGSASGSGSIGDADTASSPAASVKSDLTSTSLLTAGVEANSLKLRKTSSGFIFRPTGGDPYLYYNIGKGEAGTLRLLYLRLKSTNFNKVRQMQIFFMREESDDPDPYDSQLFYIGRGYPETCLIIPDDVSRIRLDFPEDYKDTHVASLELIETKAASGMFDELAATKVSDISMTGGTYRATVTDEDGGMLCIPLLYSGSWTATVNGESAGVQNINGGLIGVQVEGGKSEVELTYHVPHLRLALVLSCLAALVWLALFIRPPFAAADDWT